MQTSEYAIKFTKGEGVFQVVPTKFWYKGISGWVVACKPLHDSPEAPKDLFIRFQKDTYETNYRLTYPMSNWVRDIDDTFINCIRVGESKVPVDITTSSGIRFKNLRKAPMSIATLDEEGRIVPYKEDITIRLTLTYKEEAKSMLEYFLDEMFKGE